MNKPQFINELNIPAVAAPMFLISGPEIVIECCKNMFSINILLFFEIYVFVLNFFKFKQKHILYVILI